MIGRAALVVLALALPVFALLGCGGNQAATQTKEAAAGPPIVTSISPDSGPVGCEATITGSGFGENQGKVTFSGIAAICKSWEDEEIVAAVPTGARTGEVRVATAGGDSNPIGFTVLEPAPGPPPAPDGISWEQAKNHIGETATVYGPVVGVKWATSSKGQPTFLNIGRNYPDPARFTVLIWGDDRANFPSAPETFYAGKTVSATGLIQSYQGAAEIIVSSPSQIKAVE